MGLKDDLINAKIEKYKSQGIDENMIDTSDGSSIEREAEATKEAIANFITEANFTVTNFKAPVILEDFKIPDQPVNVGLQTLLGDKKPILDALRKLASIVGPQGTAIVDALENEIEDAVKPLLEGGATAPGPDINKKSGGLESSGYVYIGEDPDSQGGFDVEGEDGQREFTTVKLFRDDIEGLL